MYDVQAARGVDWVQVPVRDDAVRDAPLPGAARVRVRLQGDGEGPDREGESGGEGREAREDLNGKRTKKGVMVISCLSSCWLPMRNSGQMIDP